MPRFLFILFFSISFCASAQKEFEVHGHRGFRGKYPENTITAFRQAAKLGVDYLELDVIISKDSQVVVSHEPWFNPAICSEPDGTPVKRCHRHNLHRMDYAEIRRYDCGKRGHPEFPEQLKTPEYKPLLSEMIDSVESCIKQNGLAPVGYNIEIKNNRRGDRRYHTDPETFARLVIQAISKYDVRDRVVIQSFDERSLQKIHAIDPALKIGLLTWDRLPVNYHLKKLGFIPYSYNPRFRTCNEKRIRQAHAQNCKVIAWTADEVSDMQKLKDKGVDGIITDFPDKAMKLK
jgi:glycerophosphoryl diester phosphodiesterase